MPLSDDDCRRLMPRSPRRWAPRSRSCGIERACRTSMAPSTTDMYFGAWLRHGPGSPVADGSAAPSGARPPGRNPRPGVRRERPVHRAVGIAEIAAREVERTDDATRRILDSFVAASTARSRHVAATCRSSLGCSSTNPSRSPCATRSPFCAREWWSLNGRLYTLAIGEAAQLLPAHLRAAFLTPEAPEHPHPPDGAAVSAEPSQPGRTTALLGTGDGPAATTGRWPHSHTQSGHALLCSDPHQPFWVPSSWYEYALHGPEGRRGRRRPSGRARPVVGLNGDIAWGITNNAASTRDLYREQVHPTDPCLYRDGDTWRRFEERTVEVQRARAGAGAPHPARRRSAGRSSITSCRASTATGERAAGAALGRPGAPGRCAADGRHRPSTGLGGVSRCAARLVGGGVQLRLRRRGGRVGYQCAGRVPIRGRVVRGATATRTSRPIRGRATSRSTRCRTSSTRARGYVASANERVAPDDYPVCARTAVRPAASRRADPPGARGERRGSSPTRPWRCRTTSRAVAPSGCARRCWWLADADGPGRGAAARNAGADGTTATRWRARRRRCSRHSCEVWQERVAREHFPAELCRWSRGRAEWRRG